ncbi:MAG: HAMP domain-containing histidine kinase [Verrucomicrobiales bacterium]|nr:HAMP domain-containing histidine kinase [Verrucomicrobiales bacterium]
MWWSAGLSLTGVALLLGFAYFEFIHEHPEFLSRSWTPEMRRSFVHSIKEVGLFAGLPACILALGGAWWLFFIKRALEPLEQLTVAAEAIDPQTLLKPLPRTGNQDEIDRLAVVLNESNIRVHEAMQRIRDFSLHASHELKTPLTVLRGGLESDLREGGLTSGQRENVVGYIEEIDRLSRIVEGLSLLARADANQVELRHEPVPLHELMREALEDGKVLGESRSIEMRLKRCDEVMISGDRHRLRQLLLNLIDNAVKYNLQGGWVEAELVAGAEETLLSFSNSGPGLSAELQGHVFDRFFRGDSSHNRAVEGCGLGLSICQWIVQAHGGKIEFTSDPGVVTRVMVRFPTASAAV